MYVEYMRDMYVQKQGKSARGEREKNEKMYTGDVLRGGKYVEESKRDEGRVCGML